MGPIKRLRRFIPCGQQIGSYCTTSPSFSHDGKGQFNECECVHCGEKRLIRTSQLATGVRGICQCQSHSPSPVVKISNGKVTRYQSVAAAAAAENLSEAAIRKRVHGEIKKLTSEHWGAVS